ncbi:hypothetical protein BC567DRAFT_266443 [Phyllosticta citribraziliensis]
MPVAQLERNQEMTWEVNFRLGIYEPFIEELDQVPGGKHSQESPFYPFEGMSDFSSVMLLVAKGEDLTEASFNMWQRMLDILHYSLGPDDVVEPHESSGPTDAPSVKQSPDSQLSLSRPLEVEDLPTPPGSSQLDPSQPAQDFPLSPHNSKKSLEEIGRNNHLPTPPVSSQPGPDLSSGISTGSPGLLAQTPPSSNSGPKAPMTPEMDNVSQIDETSRRPPRRTLPEFYSLLDMIERTSYVGARFLEAYAEGLRNDCCTECWFTLNVGDVNEDTP